MARQANHGWRQIALGACASIALLSLARYASADDAPSAKTYTIIYAGNHTAGDPQSDSQKDFATAVGKASNDRIKVQIHTGGDLGSPDALLKDVRLGTIGMTYLSPQILSEAFDGIGVLGQPFLFASYDDATAKLASPAMEKLSQQFEAKAGLKILAWEQLGFTQLISKKKGISTLADLKNLRVRTITDNISTGTWTAVGAVPVPLSSAETYTAFQQNTIDGDTLPLNSIDSRKEYEVAGNLVVANVNDNLAAVVVNAKLFNALPADLQKAVRAAAASAAEIEVKASAKSDDVSLAHMKSQGAAVTTFAASERDVWASKTASLAGPSGQALVAAIRSGN